jgi:alanyl-tRNA synthetase
MRVFFFSKTQFAGGRQMKSSEVRQKFLDFFASKGHRIEPSASLVPFEDPSLLWINAGMAPLKKYFDGSVIPENPRMANSQKCIRTNDIENVGKTRRHHTFFEMLGNFSIGDYFKEEAITWAWEFLTSKEWIGFDPEKLSVTVYPEDNEAFEFWSKKVGLPENRIYREPDNFWDIGEGPCGPCTEIFYDRGEAFGDLSDPDCYPGGENERFLEVWNLVFSQFNHNKDGSYTPLPKKNIDTGMGLERMTSILQDVDSNFDTDLFRPMMDKAAEIAGIRYNDKAEFDVALKVIADHTRTVVFSVGDGVIPSNEGRGYVIRRLLRRAVRYGKVIGIDRPFLYQLTPIVGEIMGVFYEEVVQKREHIERVIRNEEERFHETLNEGLQILSDLVNEAKVAGRDEITGVEAFKLYDTYGFPFDLTEDFVAEHGFRVDRSGFDQAMQEQRDRARAARQETGSMKIQVGALVDLTTESQFIGYNELSADAVVSELLIDGGRIEEAGVGQTVQILLDRTPFYAESGGQVSDAGWIEAAGLKVEITDLFKAPNGQHVHVGEVREGTIRKGMKVRAHVQPAFRDDVIKNHTATHLLHKALKEVLGHHVNQAGSLVSPDRLRFDFSHFGSISEEELATIERLVNEQIWADTAVEIFNKPIQEAKEMGAMALFGEKYGDVVRVVQVGDYSLELCGGCHVARTSQIGMFKLLGESGIGSGVRRIEAVTGRRAYEFVDGQLSILRHAAQELRSQISDVPKRIEGLQAQIREISKENDSLRARLGNIEAQSLTSQVKEIGGVPVLAAQVNAPDMDSLRGMVDELKQKLPSAIIVLGSKSDDKVQFVTAVTPDLMKKGYHAGQIVKEVASICGGGGGGRPDMAQAGGKDPSKLQEALQAVEKFITAKV